MALDRINLPHEVTWHGLAACFFIPGLAVWLRGPRLWGRAAMMACGVLFLIYIALLGYPTANFAYGLILSIHATGFVYYCRPIMSRWELGRRIFFTGAVLLAIGLLLYSPLRAFQAHWLVPVRVHGEVVVMRRVLSPGVVRRGDWVMYSLAGAYQGDPEAGGAIWLQSGYGWGPVLALGGDHVAFSTNRLSINGVNYPLQPHMPQDGEIIVPEKHWFVWPEIDISGHGHVRQDAVSSAMMHLAVVPETEFIGKPFKSWFWREQILQ